jgi:hypothetical protein
MYVLKILLPTIIGQVVILEGNNKVIAIFYTNLSLSIQK